MLNLEIKMVEKEGERFTAWVNLNGMRFFYASAPFGNTALCQECAKMSRKIGLHDGEIFEFIERAVAQKAKGL